MAEKKTTTGRLVLVMPDYVPEETLAHYIDVPEKLGRMLMRLCVEMHDVACTKAWLWFVMNHVFKRNEQQRNIRKCGMCAAKAEAVNVLQEVEHIYCKSSTIRCRKKGGKMVA